MALTINPAVSGSGKRHLVHAAAFFAGIFLGALFALVVVVAAVSIVRLVIPTAGAIAIAVGLVIWGVLHDLGLPLRLPYRRRQVPEWFRRTFPPGTVAALFGVQLGVGVLTLFTYSTHIAMLVALPFLDSVRTMLLVILLFAVGKTLVLALTLGADTLEEVSARFRWTPTGARLLRLANASVAAWAAFVLLSIPLG
jgi:hypothetical protein